MVRIPPTLEEAKEHLEALQGWFRFYVVALGIMALQILAEVGRWMFSMCSSTEQEAFGFKWPPNYFSLALGLVFAVFVLVLFLQMQRTRETVEPLLRDTENSQAMRRVIEWQAWLASPLRPGRCGQVLFWGLLGAGWLRVASMVFGHAFLDPRPPGNLPAFRSIAAVDALVLVLTGYLMWRIRRETRAIDSAAAPSREAAGR